MGGVRTGRETSSPKKVDPEDRAQKLTSRVLWYLNELKVDECGGYAFLMPFGNNNFFAGWSCAVLHALKQIPTLCSKVASQKESEGKQSWW